MIDPITGSALIGAAGSLIGGFLGLGGSKNAANAQLQAARETNRQNLDIYYSQVANMWNMWNKTNAYNDPSQQMARFRAAGVNPYFALGSMNAGTATSMAGAPSAPNIVTPDVASPMMQGVNSLANGIAGAGQSIASAFSPDAEVKRAQAEAISIDNQSRSVRNYMEISKMENEIMNSKLDASQKKLLVGITRATANVKIKQEYEMLVQKQLENASLRVGIQIQDQQLQDWIFKNTQLNPIMRDTAMQNLQNLIQQNSLNIAYYLLTAKKTNAEIQKLAADTAKTIVDTMQAKFNLSVDEETRSSIVKQVISSADKTAAEANKTLTETNLMPSMFDLNKKRYNLEKEKFEFSKSSEYWNRAFRTAEIFHKFYDTNMGTASKLAGSVLPLLK